MEKKNFNSSFKKGFVKFFFFRGKVGAFKGREVGFSYVKRIIKLW